MLGTRMGRSTRLTSSGYGRYEGQFTMKLTASVAVIGVYSTTGMLHGTIMISIGRRFSTKNFYPVFFIISAGVHSKQE